MKWTDLPRFLTREQQLQIAIDMVRGITAAETRDATGWWLRAINCVRACIRYGRMPDLAAEARHRAGLALPDDPEPPPAVLDLGRVHRASGERAEPVAVEPALVWAQVDRSGGPESCWPWTGRHDEDGYGRYRSYTAMRVVWGLITGSVPPGMQICHRCDNPPCCNPAHLFVATQQENARDAERKRIKRRIAERSVVIPVAEELR